jgi:thiol-disulfide isomerase/thioredoxin
MKAVYAIVFLVFCSVYNLLGQDNTENKNNSTTYLTGEVTRVQLEADELFSLYHQKQYKNYSPTATNLDFNELSAFDIKVVLGIWCHDSQVQVPRFLKIMDETGYKKEMSFIAVDTDKNAPGNLIDNLDIIRVPTFIFYKDDLEAGRIIESPEETLERDIAAIVKQN